MTRLPAWLLLITACGGAGEGRSGDEAGSTAATPRNAAPAVAPADSLALSLPGGDVWYTLARPGTSVDGRPCVDRALEIRRGEARIPVPLLYTGTAPEPVNESTFRARLSDRCVPADSYLVNLKSGRPTPER